MLPLPGSYTLALTANDGQLSTTSFVQITVLLNHAPVVKVAPDQNIFSSGDSDGNRHRDSHRRWPASGQHTHGKLGPGPVPAGHDCESQPDCDQVQLPGPGFYEFEISATDGVLTSHATQSITVFNGPPPAVPVVSIASLAEEDDLHKPVPVIGSVSGGKWTLDYRLNNDDGAATTPLSPWLLGPRR